MTEAEQNRLIIDNMWIVEPIAAYYRGQKSIPFEDITASGREGLVKAARNYDRSKSQFQTWATHKINSAIQDFIRDWEEMDPGGRDEKDIERLWYEWTNGLFQTNFEHWVGLAASPEEIVAQFNEIAHRRTSLSGAMMNLDRRERAIITARFIREPFQTLESIAREQRISYARTVFLIDRALKKLKNVLDRQDAKLRSDGKVQARRAPQRKQGRAAG